MLFLEEEYMCVCVCVCVPELVCCTRLYFEKKTWMWVGVLSCIFKRNCVCVVFLKGECVLLYFWDGVCVEAYFWECVLCYIWNNEERVSYIQGENVYSVVLRQEGVCVLRSVSKRGVCVCPRDIVPRVVDLVTPIQPHGRVPCVRPSPPTH